MDEGVFELGEPTPPSRGSRRIAAVSAVAALALVAAGGAWALTRSEHDTGRDRLSSAAGSPDASTSEAQSTSAATPTRPAASPTQDPTSAATATALPTANASDSTPSDGLGPRPPGSVSVPYSSGQHSWSGTSDGIHLSMSMSPTTPKAGELVTFHITASGADDDCCGIYVVWGDGQVDPGNGVDCMSGLGHGGSNSVTWQHVYNKSGRHTFLLQGISHHCDHNGELYGSLEIGAGVSTSQGPSLPVVETSQSTRPAGHESDPSWISLYGHASDRDGYLTSFLVTWGDGTSQTFDATVDACQRSRDGWPGASEAWVPHEPPPAHHYAKPGDYTVTLTAFSTGCDGKQRQSGHSSFAYSWSPPETSAPQPSASASPTPTP